MKNILNNKEYHQKSSSTLQRELEEYFNNTDPKKNTGRLGEYKNI